MSDLEINLTQILQEKETKIIPENIKKDIQIFDVIGTYEGSGGTVAGDANLLPENIKSGVTIFGVTGTYTGETVE